MYVQGLRKVIQDLLVSELMTVQVEIRHLNEGLKVLHEEMDKRFEAMHKEMDERFAKVDERFTKVDERIDGIYKILVEMQKTQEKILSRLDFEPRISRLEAYYEAIKVKLERQSHLILKETGQKYSKKRKT